MGTAFLVKRSGGSGGAGGTLSVKSLDAGTISIMHATDYDVKDPKPQTVKANDTVVFKGLVAGEWEVRLNGALRATVTIEDNVTVKL